MFDSLRRKFKGVQDYHTLLNKSLQYVIRLKSNQDNSDFVYLHALKEQPTFYKSWLENYSNELKTVADVNSISEQTLALRKIIIDQIKIYYNSNLFFDEKDYTEEDKKILTHALLPEIPHEEAMNHYIRRNLESTLSMRCLRNLSIDFKDAKKNDWFMMYCDLYSNYIKSHYDFILSKAKGDIYIFEAFIPHLLQTIAEAEKNILLGKNYDYDKEAIEKERELEEIERKEKEPKKQKQITGEQIDKLVDYLFSRYHLLCEGKLYNVLGHTPTNPLNILHIDSGLVLIGLTECLDDRETAFAALRKILFKLAFKIAPNHNDFKKEDDINLGIQEVILSTREDTENSWLTKVCVFIPYYLFDIEQDELSEQQKKQLGEASAPLISEAFNVYAATKNLFGWDIEILDDLCAK